VPISAAAAIVLKVPLVIVLSRSVSRLLPANAPAGGGAPGIGMLKFLHPLFGKIEPLK
jgi:hypothetical protein